MTASPQFAVVGHPNKGKSSIVATLARDESVAIGAEPGTTTICRDYPMVVNGTVLYTLVDTPGFQRSRRTLAWMKEQARSPGERPQAVRRFVESPEARELFPDECELLRPITAGAGILYVVDGSVPYGPDYEAELEILQWTGQPRMALINPISSEAFVEQWRAALGQYFSVVRVFNAVMADFGKQVELLRVFGELREEWREPLAHAVRVLTDNRRQRTQRAAQEISATIVEMLEHKLERGFPGDQEHVEQYRSALESEFIADIRELEERCRKRVEDLFWYSKLRRHEPEFAILEPRHLFSEASWRLFGLSRKELLLYSAVGGGAAGAVIDIAVGGASVFAGTVIGSVFGTAAAAIGGNKLHTVRVITLPIGKKVLVAGPVKHLNFPHLVFNRARLHYYLLSRRTHARRDPLVIPDDASQLTALSGAQTAALESGFSRLRSEIPFRAPAVDILQRAVEEILLQDDGLQRSSWSGQSE